MRPMLTQWMMTALTLGAFVSVAHGARAPKTLDTTATSLYFIDNPKAELASKQTLDAVAGIKKELQALLDTHVVAAKHEEFYLPSPFVYGVLHVRVTDTVWAALAPGIDKNGILDVSGSIGFPALDALNRKWNITQYKREYPFSTHFKVSFDPGINPHLVADSFAAASEVKWTAPSSLAFIGGGTAVTRITPKTLSRNFPPPLYVLTLGWGDCPAGCMALHRRYFEVRIEQFPDAVKVRYVGEAGAPLPADMLAEYYK